MIPNLDDEMKDVKQRRFNPVLKIASVLGRGKMANVPEEQMGNLVSEIVYGYFGNNSNPFQFEGDATEYASAICLAEMGGIAGLALEGPGNLEEIAGEFGRKFSAVIEGLLKIKMSNDAPATQNAEPVIATELYELNIPPEMNTNAFVAAEIIFPALERAKERLPYVSEKQDLIRLAGICIAAEFMQDSSKVIESAKDPKINIDEVAIMALAQLGIEAGTNRGINARDIVQKYLAAKSYKKEYISNLHTQLAGLAEEIKAYSKIAEAIIDEIRTWDADIDVQKVGDRDGYLRLKELLRNPKKAAFRLKVGPKYESDAVLMRLKTLKSEAKSERRAIGKNNGMDFVEFGLSLAAEIKKDYGIDIKETGITDEKTLKDYLSNMEKNLMQMQKPAKKNFGYLRDSRFAALQASRLADQFVKKWRRQRNVELREQIGEARSAIKRRKVIIKSAKGGIYMDNTAPLPSAIENILEKCDAIAMPLEKAENDFVSESIPTLRALGLRDSLIKDFLGLYLSGDILGRYIPEEGTLDEIGNAYDSIDFKSIVHGIREKLRDKHGIIARLENPQKINSISDFEKYRDSIARTVLYANKAVVKPNLIRNGEVIIIRDGEEMEYGKTGTAIDYKAPNVLIKARKNKCWIPKEAIAPTAPAFDIPKGEDFRYMHGDTVMLRADSKYYPVIGDTLFTTENSMYDTNTKFNIRAGDTILTITGKDLELVESKNGAYNDETETIKRNMELARKIAYDAANSVKGIAEFFTLLETNGAGLAKSLGELGVLPNEIETLLAIKFGESACYAKILIQK